MKQTQLIAVLTKKDKALHLTLNPNAIEPTNDETYEGLSTAVYDVTQCSIVEEILGDDTTINEEAHPKFWDLQRSLNRVSAVPPDYETACHALHLELVDPAL